ncbi:hypothetical protein CCS92_29070, partial [Methylobacterium radiotolerans]
AGGCWCWGGWWGGLGCRSSSGPYCPTVGSTDPGRPPPRGRVLQRHAYRHMQIPEPTRETPGQFGFFGDEEP